MLSYLTLVFIIGLNGWLCSDANAESSFCAMHSVQRPVHTYSIVARDAATGQLGVAVQSHWFSVGSVVSWAEPGVSKRTRASGASGSRTSTTRTPHVSCAT